MKIAFYGEIIYNEIPKDCNYIEIISNEETVYYKANIPYHIKPLDYISHLNGNICRYEWYESIKIIFNFVFVENFLVKKGLLNFREFENEEVLNNKITIKGNNIYQIYNPIRKLYEYFDGKYIYLECEFERQFIPKYSNLNLIIENTEFDILKKVVEKNKIYYKIRISLNESHLIYLFSENNFLFRIESKLNLKYNFIFHFYTKKNKMLNIFVGKICEKWNDKTLIIKLNKNDDAFEEDILEVKKKFSEYTLPFKEIHKNQIIIEIENNEFHLTEELIRLQFFLKN
ncbi:hypothetical protein LUQ84_000514 [Hamiltosporidium tvaerminnensis]|nr:hypothetical protein LUQ84_000514 [Hamiltosporidium tvaerminnensis]